MEAAASETRQRGMAPLIPVRKLVQWSFCNRLGILEWLHAEFEPNHFTVEGSHIHRRVDRPGASLESLASRGDETDEDDFEGASDPTLETRSLYLESEAEGLVARMDLVELRGGPDGEVVPVETKRGRPPRPDQDPAGAWEEDRVQVCAQALILRDHGYRCEQAFIFYASTRRRVAVPIDDALVALTRGALRAFREAAAEGGLPAPLVDSPKCRGCSLSGICLPDETVLLRGLRGDELGGPEDDEDEGDRDVVDAPCGDDGPGEEDGLEVESPRTGRAVRVLVADEHRRPLYVTDSAARLGIEKGLFVVKRYEDGKPLVVGKARIRDTSHVAIFGRAQVSTMALRAAMDRGVPVSFFTYGGYFTGSVVGHTHKNVVLREAQWKAAMEARRCLNIARQIVRSKVRNQRTMLRRNATGLSRLALREMSAFALKAEEATSLEQLLGYEGGAAAVYFREFERMIKVRAEDGGMAFEFSSRNRRPPRDPVNALLSLVYALLSRECAAVATAVGLDAYMGFYHQPRYGRPALALDLMEEFRPLVADSVVLSVINQAEVGPGDFVYRADGCNLTDRGRKAVLKAYERRMRQELTHPVFGYRASWRRVIEIQARLLAKHLLGEVPAYIPIETR